ncbi:PRKAA2_2 [Blepharisma stoltei]|uniref:non-specific serine/threonine protein kinase n=1 Tax=Blepharisma stoltei TaxID=1481888 RepID=A0AAU9IK42_9CILI|nr:unnamed protein product [Blepharisma stoltei]
MSSLENYIILGPLGRGTFGQVKLAEHILTNVRVAIKVLKRKVLAEKHMINKVKREIRVLKSFHHPHIIRLYDVISTPTCIFLVMECLPGGELYNLLDRNGRLPEDQARLYFQQIISGLDYCHTHRVVHRDIKPENILLDQFGNIKIADFGLSNLMPDGDYLKTSCGSPNYAAPEVISGTRYCGPEVDIWSAGVVLFALLAGHLPFDDSSIPSLFAKIKASSFSMPYHFSDPVKDLIARMLKPDPIARMTINQIKKHPWVQMNYDSRLLAMNRITSKSYRIIDEEILMKCLDLPSTKYLTIEEFREKIVNRKNESSVVCYELLLDKKLNEMRIRNGDRVSNVTPIFKSKNTDMSNLEISTRASSSQGENIDILFDKDGAPDNWVYGFRTDLEAYPFMMTLFATLKDANLEWKLVTNFKLRVRSIDSPYTLKMQIDIYKYQRSFVVDIKLLEGTTMVFLETLHRLYTILYDRTYS